MKIKQNCQSRKQIDSKIQTLNDNFENFIVKKLKPLVSHTEKLLFSNFEHLYWDPSLKYQVSNQLNQSNYRLESSTDYYFQMTSPSIQYSTFFQQLSEQRIVQIKLSIQTGSYVLFGIGLLKKLKQRNFKISEKEIQNYGCFMKSNDHTVYIVKKDGKSSITKSGIDVRSKDLIQIDIDMKLRTIKFINLTTLSEKTVKIEYVPEIENDQYNFCIGLKNQSDQVKAFSI